MLHLKPPWDYFYNILFKKMTGCNKIGILNRKHNSNYNAVLYCIVPANKKVNTLSPTKTLNLFSQKHSRKNTQCIGTSANRPSVVTSLAMLTYVSTRWYPTKPIVAILLSYIVYFFLPINVCALSRPFTKLRIVSKCRLSLSF